MNCLDPIDFLSRRWVAQTACGTSLRKMLVRFACAVLAALLALCAIPVAAQTVTASNGLSCAGARGGALNCTAGEFTATVSITKAPEAPDTCIAGQYFNLDGTIGLSGSNADRYNIGFFTGEDGNDPKLAGGTCSVATFPTSPLPWLNKDSNACGDYLAAGVSTPLVKNLRTKCVASASGQLQVPYVVTYQQNSATCTGPGDVTSGAPSKCNAGTSTVNGIWVVPAISIDDGLTSIASGAATTYTVVISNASGLGMSNLVFTDPAVAGISLSGVTCTATGGGVCPASPSVAGLQGAGLTITSLPDGASLTFTIPATLTGAVGASITNTVSIALSGGQSTSAGDTNRITQGCTQPANTPSGLLLNCVCDTFGRAALNPSTIFGGNWSVSNSDGLGNPYINATTGLLRLTESTGNNAKAATVPSIFPAAGNYISAEFMHYAYYGSNPGADGIAVTLSDYSVPAVPGGFGGSLGYAQRTGVVGFAGGWVGVALDEWGNYQNPTEGRVGGSGFIAQSVGVRGPGSGTSGYRWMGGTASSPGGLRIDSLNRTSTTPAPGYMYQVVVDARDYATGTVSVSVNRDATTKDGSTYTALFGPFNAYPEASYAQSQGWITKLVPDYWKISFTGSTGGADNIHEIGSLRICAQTIYPDTGGTASGFSAIDEAYPGAPSVPAYPNFQTGNIYMKLAGTPFKLWVAALTGSGISSGYSATSNKYVQVKIVDNTDNACGTDAARTCNAACTGKTAVEAGATQVATFVSGSSTGVASPSPTFTLNSAYRNLIAVMKECTTSTCAAFTATAPACSADSFSVRPLSIASVISSNATNIGSTGTPIFKADSDNFSLTATTTGVAGSPSKYNGIMTINNALVQAVAPATVAGTVSGVFPAASSGTPSSTATGAAFTYSEVGAFSLPGYTPATGATPDTTARAVYDDTWTAIDSISTKGDCLANSYSNGKVGGKYGCNFGLLPNATVFGRFIPYEFRVSSPVLTNRPAAACLPASTFSYLDEGIGLAYTLEARSATGNITKNYAGTFAKLTLPADGSTMNFAAAVVGPPFVPIAGNRIVGSGFTGTWPALGAASAGQVPLAGTVTVSSLTIPTNNRVSPDGPFINAAIGIAPVDSDGVRIMVYDLDSDNSGGVGATDHLTLGTTSLYFGVMRLLPAIGSERLPLTMSAEILRWNGAGFVPNGNDSCTQIPAARLSLSGWTKNLGAGETTLPAGALTFAAGRGVLGLSAPGAGNDGTVLVTADLTGAGLGYLTGRWGGATRYIQNPSAIAAFGLYKGAGQIIHFRENY